MPWGRGNISLITMVGGGGGVQGQRGGERWKENYIILDIESDTILSVLLIIKEVNFTSC